MPTMPFSRCETRSISIAAPPHVVVDLLADPRRLPDWAPVFAEAVEQRGDDWVVTSGGRHFKTRVSTSPEHGVVDLAAPGSRTEGARMRVLPNQDGAELVFTLVFPAGVNEAAIRQQMLTVEDELRTVRDICETASREAAGPPAPPR